MQKKSDHHTNVKNISRRDFIKSSSTVLAGGLLGSQLTLSKKSYGWWDSATIRVGLIGCGGRGTGAAYNAAKADAQVEIVAMGDAFQDRLENSLNHLKRKLGAQCQVPQEKSYIGFNAYQNVIDSDVDLVIIATPPQFHPLYLEAAIKAGKHVFVEKPIAVDSPGVRKALAAFQEAKRKGLSAMSGLCYRYDNGVKATVDRIHNKDLGDIASLSAAYMKGSRQIFKREPSWTDMDWQLRNWRHYTWLSGDEPLLILIHNLDMIAWAMGGYPVRAWGMGGKEVDTVGSTFDHHSAVLEYESGVRLFGHCRTITGCTFQNSSFLYGSKGVASLMEHKITGPSPFEYTGPKNNMYQTEFDDLIASIRTGNPINQGDYLTKSTLTAIMARWACYTGKELTWDEVWNANKVLGPKIHEFGPVEGEPVAIPGKTVLE